MRIPEYNRNKDAELQVDFYEALTDKLVCWIDSHKVINDKRGLNLFRAKTWLMVAVLTTIINWILTVCLLFWNQIEVMP